MSKLAPENVLIRPPTPEVKLVATAMAWRDGLSKPLVEAMIEQIIQDVES
jgi:hypothetical protein